MQEMYSQVPGESSGKVAMREGTRMGLLLGAAYLLLTVLGDIIANNALLLLILLATFFIWPIAFFIAGQRGARGTARVSTGTLAGLWTGVIGGIIGFIVDLVGVLLNMGVARQNFQSLLNQLQQSGYYNVPHPTDFMVIGVNALGTLCLLLIGIAVSAGLGALGGLLGRSQSPVRFAPYPQAPYSPPVQPRRPEEPPVE